jgi:spermidine synthase
VVELDYVQRMLASLLWLPTDALGQGRAVQLGLGAGAITRFTRRRWACTPRRWRSTRWWSTPAGCGSACPPTGRACRCCACRRAALAARRRVPGSVRLLHVDLYDHEAAAPVLDDEAFYAACRRVLAPGGVMSVNLFGRHASFAASAARIAAAFGADQVWSLRPTREGNTVVVAGQGVVVPRARNCCSGRLPSSSASVRLGLPARAWLRMVRPTPGRLPPPALTR